MNISRCFLSVLLAFLAPAVHGATFTVTTAADSGAGSLRQAVVNANALPGADTITFNTFFIESVATVATYDSVVVRFSQAVEPGSASDPFNYSVSGLNVFAATVSPDGRSVTLTTDPLTPATSYTLIVTGVSSLLGAVLPNTTVPFSGTPGITYTGPAITLTTGEILIASSLTIEGSHGTISGGDATRVFHIASGGHVVGLKNLRILDGKILGGGGGVWNQGGALTLDRCVVESCTSDVLGGGLFTAGGSLTLLDCHVAGNTCTGPGGGLFNDNAALTLTGTTFSGNGGTGSGGALYNAPAGSGVATQVKNCTFTGNTVTNAGESGGAIIATSGQTVLTHCTVTGNTAPDGRGSGVATNGSGQVTATGSIIAGNGGASSDVDALFVFGGGGFLSGGGNLISTGNALASFTPPGDQTGVADPLLAALGNYAGLTPTRPPLPGSPALDAASVVAGLATDQRGLARASGSLPDIGAVELQEIRVTTTADENDGNLAGAVSLREAIAHNVPGVAEVVRFDPALSGATLPLTAASGGQITVARNVTVDARDLPLGVKIDGGLQSFRLFQVNGGASLALHGLTLANGRDGGGTGGAIYNGGTLTLTRCTLTGNQATGGNGGAIYNLGTATLTHCTLAGNTASGGGAIYHIGPGSLTLTHCTLSGNTAGFGGGIDNFSPLTLTNTLIAGNTATNGANFGPEIFNSGTITREGVNLVQNLDNSGGGTSSNGPGTILATAAPLAGLAYYGGGTPTMPPLAGSPAIDPAAGTATSPFPTDQRGLPRVVNGKVDIGAVEYSAATTLSATVVNTANSGPGSLRDTLAAVPTGSTLTFAPALSGGTIALSAPGQMLVAKAVTVDALSLPAGLTLNGGSQGFRHFEVTAAANLTLHGLTLANGGGPGFGFGGAIFVANSGTLTLTRCTLAGHISVGVGGAIATGGAATLTHCTLSGNVGGGGGGAILNAGSLALTHCTVSGNTAPQGGGIRNDSMLTLANSIIAGNTATNGAGSGPDVLNSGFATLTREGVNLVPFLTNNGNPLVGGGSILPTPPMLAPLGSYGGPTRTMALLPGSPARNAAGPGATSDQRGFPIVAPAPDIGAYEAGTFTNFNAYIWERLPTAGNGTTTDPLHAQTYDFDGDGVTNLNEWLALTNPSDHTSYLRVTGFTRASPNVTVTFPSVLGRSYTFESSPDLVTWTPIAGTPVPGTDANLVIQLGPFPGATRLFVKVRTGP